jgi:hypothetical protein
LSSGASLPLRRDGGTTRPPGAVTASPSVPVAAPSYPAKLAAYGIDEALWRRHSVALVKWQERQKRAGEDDDPVTMSFRFGARLYDQVSKRIDRGRT